VKHQSQKKQKNHEKTTKNMGEKSMKRLYNMATYLQQSNWSEQRGSLAHRLKPKKMRPFITTMQPHSKKKMHY